MPFLSIKPKLNIAHCILQRKPLGSYTMLPITIGVYFSISYMVQDAALCNGNHGESSSRQKKEPSRVTYLLTVDK